MRHLVKNLTMFNKIGALLISALLLNSCGILPKKNPDNTEIAKVEKKKRISPNVRERLGEDKGIIFKNTSKGGTIDFASTNPLWQATLETLEFMPLDNASYSGGVIVTDWYSGENGNLNEQIKISVKFVSKEITPSSFEVISHKKKCDNGLSCKISLASKDINSKLKEQIMKKAIEINIKNVESKK